MKMNKEQAQELLEVLFDGGYNGEDKTLKAEMDELFKNKSCHHIGRVELGYMLDKIYGTDKEIKYCSCKGWGCLKCCANEAEVRARQGTFG